MSTYPRLMERNRGNISLSIWNRSGVASYTVRASTQLTGVAYSDLFNVTRGALFRSPTLRRKRLGVVDESRRGQTHVAFDLGDYSSATVPSDLATSFIQIRELDGSGATLSDGPVMVVPPPGFFATGRRNLVLNGTAPEGAAGANNLPPVTGGIVVALPKFADEVSITNTDAANSLFVSFGAGLQEVELAFGTSQTFTEAGVDLLYLRSDNAAGTDFVATFAIVNGLQS